MAAQAVTIQRLQLKGRAGVGLNATLLAGLKELMVGIGGKRPGGTQKCVAGLLLADIAGADAADDGASEREARQAGEARDAG